MGLCPYGTFCIAYSTLASGPFSNKWNTIKTVKVSKNVHAVNIVCFSK